MVGLNASRAVIPSPNNFPTAPPENFVESESLTTPVGSWVLRVTLTDQTDCGHDIRGGHVAAVRHGSV